MSTQVNTYVLYGVLLQLKDCPLDELGLYNVLKPYTDSAFDPATNPANGITALCDGLNGDYLAIGHVIAKTDCDTHLNDPVSIPAYALEIWSWAAAVADHAKELGYDLSKLQPSWIVVSHYR